MEEVLYFVFTCMPDESYSRRLRSVLCLCDVFRALIKFSSVDSEQALWASFLFQTAFQTLPSTDRLIVCTVVGRDRV